MGPVGRPLSVHDGRHTLDYVGAAYRYNLMVQPDTRNDVQLSSLI